MEDEILEEAKEIVLQEIKTSRDDLSGSVKRSVTKFSNLMREKGFITEEVYEGKDVEAIMNDYEACVNTVKTFQKLEECCSGFLDVLKKIGGPAKNSADSLRDTWKREIYNKTNRAFMPERPPCQSAAVVPPSASLRKDYGIPGIPPSRGFPAELSQTVVPQNSTGIEDTDDAGKVPVPEPPDVDSKCCPPMRDIKSIPIFDLPHDINVILVTATETEFRAVIGQAKPSEGDEMYGRYSKENVTFYLGYYESYKVAIIRTGQGVTETRRKLDPVQEALGAQYVISIGICYGMKPGKVKLGDVIVGKIVMDLSIKEAKDDVRPRPVGLEAGDVLSNMFEQNAGFKLETRTGYVDVKIGLLVTEPTLVANQEYKNKILAHMPHALGGEMEAVGIIEAAKAAARKGKCEAIVIKAVADWGNEKKEPYRRWQEFASVAAAKYVLHHLKNSPNDALAKT